MVVDGTMEGVGCSVSTDCRDKTVCSKSYLSLMHQWRAVVQIVSLGKEQSSFSSMSSLVSLRSVFMSLVLYCLSRLTNWRTDSLDGLNTS